MLVLTGLLAGSATPIVRLADWRGDLNDKELHTPITLDEVHELLAKHGHRAAAIIRTRWNHGLRVLDKKARKQWLARLRLDAMKRRAKERGARGIARQLSALLAAQRNSGCEMRCATADHNSKSYSS